MFASCILYSLVFSFWYLFRRVYITVVVVVVVGTVRW